MKKRKSGRKAVKLAVLGASIAGAAATAYFFLGPKGKKHQREAKAWAIKMKGDVVEKLETAREISEPVYKTIVDSVSSMYAKRKGLGVNSKDVKALAKDLKKHWKSISARARTATSKKSKR